MLSLATAHTHSNSIRSKTKILMKIYAMLKNEKKKNDDWAIFHYSCTKNRKFLKHEMEKKFLLSISLKKLIWKSQVLYGYAIYCWSYSLIFSFIFHAYPLFLFWIRFIIHHRPLTEMVYSGLNLFSSIYKSFCEASYLNHHQKLSHSGSLLLSWIKRFLSSVCQFSS